MNYCAKAINHLQQDLNWRSLCFRLASNNPKAFCDAVEKASSLPLTPAALNMEIAKVLDGLVTNKIKAIKRYRELTSCGLGEVKDEVENIMASLHARGLLS
jgi:ribosomal protein L7/L12